MCLGIVFGDNQISGRGGYNGIAGTYRAISLKKSRDLVDLGAALTARVRQSDSGSIDLSLGVNASLAHKYADYGFRVGVGVEFRLIMVI